MLAEIGDLSTAMRTNWKRRHEKNKFKYFRRTRQISYKILHLAALPLPTNLQILVSVCGPAGIKIFRKPELV